MCLVVDDSGISRLLFGLLLFLLAIIGVALYLGAHMSTNPTPRTLGIILPWSNTYLSDLDAYTKLVGAKPGIVSNFRDWTIPLVDAKTMDGIIARGAIPQVTWESWDPNAASDTIQPAYSLASIVSGSHDAYIKASAQAAALYGKQFQVRFGAEMNGSWAPWEGSLNGNTPAQFVAAWKHVVQIFRDAGATNVVWVWAPNEGPSNTIASYYPGDAWVDVLAIDGYNWGDSDVWQTFTQVFSTPYKIITGLNADKPIQIAETASAVGGGDKAAWITNAFATEIPNAFPRITSVVWFNINKEQDWRVNSSSQTLAAYQAVAASPAWSGAAAPPVTPPPVTPPPPDPTPPPVTPPVTPPPTTALTTPAIKASSTRRRVIDLSWTAVTGATVYELQRSSTQAFSSPVSSSTGGTTATYRGSGTYWFRVRATGPNASSDWSTPAKATAR